MALSRSRAGSVAAGAMRNFSTRAGGAVQGYSVRGKRKSQKEKSRKRWRASEVSDAAPATKKATKRKAVPVTTAMCDMKVSSLRKKARALGVAASDLESVDSEPDKRAALIELITDREKVKAKGSTSRGPTATAAAAAAATAKAPAPRYNPFARSTKLPGWADKAASASASASAAAAPATGGADSTGEEQEQESIFLSKHDVTVHGCQEAPIPIEDIAAAEFPESAAEAWHRAEFKAPTPIQAVCWQLIAGKRDVIGVANTGSGKTLAFALPMLKLAQERRSGDPLGLVLTPTRELANQVRAPRQPQALLARGAPR